MPAMTPLTAAVRALRGNKSFSIVVVLTMAVAIAANTAIFSVYDQLVLRPVTMPDPPSLIAIWFNNPQRNVQTPSISIPRYEELREHTASFSSIGLSAFDSLTLTDRGDPLQLTVLRISATFLPTLGVLPAAGRNFTSAEDVPNGPAVCLISHEVWQTQFGGGEILNQTIRLDDRPWQVIGIMPPQLTAPFRQVQLFAPRVFETGGLTKAQIDAGATYAQAIARLKPGVTLEQARAELVAFSASYKVRHAGKLDANNVNEPRRFVAALVSGVEPTMYTLLGAVGCVLLIACANVASLFLSRLVQRRREIAVRLSLGATRAAIIRQYLVESLLFSGAGALLGIGLAFWALRGLQSVAAAQLPPSVNLGINWLTLLFTAGVTILCTVLTGLVPAIQASQSGVLAHLKDGDRGSSGAMGRRFRQGLTIAEVTLSVILLVSAGLLLVSFARLQNTALGFEPRGAAAAFVSIPAMRYSQPAQQAAFFEQVIANLRTQPGVVDAAVSFATPLTGAARTPYAVAGQPLPPIGQRPIVSMNMVSDDYFRLLEIPLVAGRPFNADDRSTSPRVGIVNETFAARVFPGQSALGQALIMGGNDARVEIVGVIRDVKSAGGNAPTPEEVYFPMRQVPRTALAVIARTTGDAAALQTAIRNAVTSVDKTQATAFFGTMESNVASSLATQRLVATLTGVFAGLALVLSLTGLYSVLAYLVTLRTPEIGLRMALGASRPQVVQLVLRSGLGLVVAGLVLGLGGAAGVSRLIRQLLFRIDPVSPAIYASVAVLFVIVAGLACLGPSLRASRIDPLVAFRNQ
jgi:predicted permease